MAARSRRRRRSVVGRKRGRAWGGEVNSRQIVSALWLKDGCSKALSVSSQAGPCVRVRA